jgi:hypothetical protein
MASQASAHTTLRSVGAVSVLTSASVAKKPWELKMPPAPKDEIDVQALLARNDSRRTDGATAFLPDPSAIGHRRVKDDFAEVVGEEFVANVTSDESEDDKGDAAVPEEGGEPFVTISARSQNAAGTDTSNPADAEREPLPTTGSRQAR